MGRRRPWTDEEVANLRRLWAECAPISWIVKTIARAEESIREKAEELGLGPLGSAKAAYREAHGRAVGDIRRRHFARQPDPVRLVPSRSMFGAPIRALDPDTHALIDAALAERARPRRGRRPPL